VELNSNLSKVRKLKGELLEIETKPGEEIKLKPIQWNS
jgi:hypothetical protein